MKVGIFGAAGAVGLNLAAELASRGIPFRVVGRQRNRLEASFGHYPGVEIHPADLNNPESTRAAARGLDAIVYAVGLPYSAQAFAAYPGMMRTACEAAKAEGVRELLQISNVYGYGPPRTALVAETHPREPVAVKGRWRKEQEDVTLAAHDAAGLRTQVLRLPDFYGPHAELSYAQLIFDAAKAGKTANVFAPADTPHEFVFMPDAARVVADLLAREDGWGEAYNLAGPGAITVSEFGALIYQALGEKPRLRTAGKGMVRFMGLFSPLMREFVEMLYLQQTPVMLDDSKLRRLLGEVRKTPYTEGVQRTVEWLKGARKAAA